MCQTEIHAKENHCQTDSPCFTHSSCQTSEIDMYTRQCFQNLHSPNRGLSGNSVDSDASAGETDRETVPGRPMPNNTETCPEAGNDEGSVMKDRYKYKAIQMTGNEIYIKASRFKHGILQLDTDEDGQDGEHDFGGGGDCHCGDEGNRIITLCLIETHFKAFAYRADPDQAALVRAAWSGSTLFAYEKMIGSFTSRPDKQFTTTISVIMSAHCSPLPQAYRARTKRPVLCTN